MVGSVRRRWGVAQKRGICAEAQRSGVSVAEVARRHDVNANLVFKWLRDPRFAEGGFFPVELSPFSQAVEAAPAALRISVQGGHVLDIPAGADPDFLGRLLKVWLR